MLQVQLPIAVFAKDLFLVFLEADVLAAIQYIVEQVELFVASSDELIPHPVVNVEEIVSVFASVLDHVLGEGSEKLNNNYVIIIYKL